MRITNEQLKLFLTDSNLIPKNRLEDAFKEAESSKKDLGPLLLEKELVDEAGLQKIYAYVLGIPFVDLTKENIPLEILQIVPEPIARKYNIVAFERQDKNLKVAMLVPEDLQTIDFIKKKSGYRIVPCLTTRESIQEALKHYEKSLKAEFGDLLTVTAEKADEGEDSGSLEKMASDLPVVRIVDTLLKHAILQSASDIHIEPSEKEVLVRYRIDGVLHDAMTLPRDAATGIVARIKVLSNLKLDEHRQPQDGRFKIEKDGYRISFRVSILPVFDGEKIVMRLLDESSKGLTLEKMGLTGRALEAVHREIHKPNGIILVTGPTGSGKTTTLYTVMDILNTPEVNISTVEDPVEYRMPRVNQTQINPKVGMTFAAALRSLLRQDPDILMVGEIRDQETLEIALHAAMTGHLVLSTLHTNSAAATLPRMLDMGAEPFLIASTTNVIVAQRLVRRLCQECKKPYRLDAEEAEALESSVDVKEVLASLRAEGAGVKPTEGEGKSLRDFTFYRPGGCDQCGGEGYRGRIGVYEVLEMDTDIRKLVSASATSEEIERQAKKNGMISMAVDGFVKAASGMSTIEEVLRVTKE
ncbi:MAG: Flp pilus assembly complex ATPase component TadA [Candidatus Moranbacteria bacterium]|nr:Flp pilus assembly complex ATPase component TadA [Candidatus Moranbacteria bacterium]NTW45824.1 Flp pilus assembly complex ATPase component TadA [Candidatus Moranbacteria bacterium]